MRKRSEKLAAFALGVVAAFAVTALAEPVLAAGGELLYNRVGVSLFGAERYAAGDTFTGENGLEQPASITYVDEKGGLTNYLPIRLIAELLDARIAWNAETSTVELEPPVTGDVSFSQGESGSAAEVASAPVYGTVLGAFEEIDPTAVERDAEALLPTFYINGTRIQAERGGMPEYTKTFSSAKGDCIFFTVTNNGELPQVVRVMRSVSPLSDGTRERFTSVQVEPGQTLTRAFRVAEDANPLQYELMFRVDAASEGSGATDVTLTLEQFVMK